MAGTDHLRHPWGVDLRSIAANRTRTDELHGDRTALRAGGLALTCRGRPGSPHVVWITDAPAGLPGKQLKREINISRAASTPRPSDTPTC
jgi:hypothetical protein